MDVIGAVASTGKALVERLIEYHKSSLSAMQRKRMHLLELRYNARLLDRFSESPGRVTGAKPADPALLALIGSLETRGLELLYGSVVDQAVGKPWKKIGKAQLKSAESIYLGIKTMQALLTLSEKDARNALKSVDVTRRVSNIQKEIALLTTALTAELES